MEQRKKVSLADRIDNAAQASLVDQGYVNPIEVLLRIGWLDWPSAERWRRGQVACLEEAIQTKPARTSEALTLLRSWAERKGLTPGETDYVARTPQRQTLRFSESGDPAVERLYRAQWVSPEPPEKKRDALLEKTSRPQELVVIEPLNTNWICHRCGGTGGLLIMEGPGPECLRCAGLDDLDFLAAGDALLTRRVKAKSTRSAVVVRFSRSRGRYERKGLLVEPRALSDVQGELAKRSG